MEKKEAIKILKDFHDESALFSVRTALETLYPEFKESEDERIRKVLIAGFADKLGFKWYGLEVDDIIAWLEKQSEQKPTWTKEDDVRLQACIDTLQAKSLMGKVDTVMTKWLKSLKQRIGGKL